MAVQVTDSSAAKLAADFRQEAGQADLQPATAPDSDPEEPTNEDEPVGPEGPATPASAVKVPAIPVLEETSEEEQSMVEELLHHARNLPQHINTFNYTPLTLR